MKNAVFLSASIPDPRRDVEFAKTADSVAIASAVSALCYVTLGRRPLVWGGHPAITPMIVAMCQEMDIDYGQWVRLYQSRYFEDQYPQANEIFDNIFYTDAAADGSLESSLLQMRQQMLTENIFVAGVFIGGMQGIIEEAKLFKKFHPQAQFIPVASTGGAALTLANRDKQHPDSLFSDLEYVGLFHSLLGISKKENRYREPGLQPADHDERELDLDD